MAFSREGFTADVVAGFVRRTFLNRNVIIILALSQAVSYINGYPLTAFPVFRFVHLFPLRALNIWILLGIYTHVTSYLNDQFANNWTKDTYKWNKEIVLITGGASGIGAALTSLLLKRNPSTKIVIIDHSPLTFKPPPGSAVYYYQGDLSNSSIIRQLCERIRNEVGHPTVLVNNAGLVRGTTVMEGSYADVEITIKTNLIAPFLLTKEFLPDMVRRNHGHIVSMGSMSAVTPPARIADYAATKAGLIALTEALQLELKYIHNAPQGPAIDPAAFLYQDSPDQGRGWEAKLSISPFACGYGCRNAGGHSV